MRWAAHLGGVGLGDTVLILGTGQRGLAAVLASRVAGAGTIIVTGLSRDAGKLALAREFGADYTIDVEAEDTVDRVREITGGSGADVVLELTPMAAQPIRDALQAVRWGGRVVLAGLKGGTPVELSTDVIINKALTVVGAFSVDSRAYAVAGAIITGGVAEKYPGLRLAFSHAAGGFALMLTRAQWFWGRTWNEEPPGPGERGPGPEAAPWAAETGPAELARRFYYDSLVFDRRAIRYLIDMLGADRLLVGSDFPAMPREEPAGRTLRSMGLPEAALDDITWHNCFRFLHISEPG